MELRTYLSVSQPDGEQCVSSPGDRCFPWGKVLARIDGGAVRLFFLCVFSSCYSVLKGVSKDSSSAGP